MLNHDQIVEVIRREKTHPRVEGRTQWVAIGQVEYPPDGKPPIRFDKSKLVRLVGFFDSPEEAVRAAYRDPRLAVKGIREIYSLETLETLEKILPPIITGGAG